MKRLPAVFTIEATYIFSIFFFSIATIIGASYKERNLVLCGFALSDCTEKAAHREPVYDPQGGDETSYCDELRQRLSDLGIFRGDLTVTRHLTRIESHLSGPRIALDTGRSINSPETLMRSATAVRDFIDQHKEGEEAHGDDPQ